MTEELKKAVRVGLRISADANDWLDKKSYEMGVSKTALMNFAIENYIREQTVVHDMPKIMQLVKEYEQKNM